jgi:hypothetical protein
MTPSRPTDGAAAASLSSDAEKTSLPLVELRTDLFRV